MTLRGLTEVRIPITEMRGLRIASIPGQIRRIDSHRYQVRSQSSDSWYEVVWAKRFWRCDCPFNGRTHKACKHIYAVLQRITETQSDDYSELCPRCEKVDQIIRRGFYKSRSGLSQRFECKRCNHRFGLRTGFKGMKHTASTITAVLDLFFKGLSLRSISNHLEQIYGQHISHLTIYRWIKRYVKLIDANLGTLAPQVSPTWHVDEMKVSVDGNLRNLWNLMDHKTRYLLAIQVTTKKGTVEARKLFDGGLQLAKPDKLTVISDGLSSYQRAVKDCSQETGIAIQHKADTGLTNQNSNNRLERLNGTVRQRLKTMRGLDTDKSSRIFAQGFGIFYNHVRPHSSLHGRTPGEAAKAWHTNGRNRWLSLINYKNDSSSSERPKGNESGNGQ